MSIAQNYLSTLEAAAVIGCTDAHVRRLCADGTLKAEKVAGKVWLIKRSDAERLAAKPATTGRPRKHA